MSAEGALENALGVPEVEAAAPADAAEAAGNPSAGDADLYGGVDRLLDFARARLPDALREAMRPLAGILAVTVLCALAEALTGAKGPAAETVSLGGCLAIAVIGAADVRSALRLGSETLSRLTDFSGALLGTLTAASSAAGASGASAAVWTASALFSDLLLRVSKGLVLPLVCGAVAAAAVSAVLGERQLDGAARLLQWCARGLLRVLAGAFALLLAVTRTLGATADAAAVRATRAVLRTALPVVGKLLSDASEALVAGAALLRASVGVYGLLISLGVVLLPVLRLGARVLLFRMAAALCAPVAGERQSRLIGALGGAYSLLLGLVGTAAAIVFLSILSLVRSVTP